MPKFIEMKDIDAFDMRIDIGGSWIAVHDDTGNTLLHKRAEIDGWPVASRGIVTDPELLRRWMELHLRGMVGEHLALLVAVSPNITDAECHIIRYGLSSFAPLLVWFTTIPVAAAHDYARQHPLPFEYLLVDSGEQTAWAAAISSGRMVAYKEIRGDYALNTKHPAAREIKEALQADYPTSPVLKLK